MFDFQKFSHCLALLPKSRGDEDSWSLMMQKILLTINVHLNDAFQGLEDGNSNHIVELICFDINIYNQYL